MWPRPTTEQLKKEIEEEDRMLEAIGESWDKIVERALSFDPNALEIYGERIREQNQDTYDHFNNFMKKAHPKGVLVNGKKIQTFEEWAKLGSLPTAEILRGYFDYRSEEEARRRHCAKAQLSASMVEVYRKEFRAAWNRISATPLFSADMIQ